MDTTDRHDLISSRERARAEKSHLLINGMINDNYATLLFTELCCENISIICVQSDALKKYLLSELSDFAQKLDHN
jgi:hypothetical protein